MAHFAHIGRSAGLPVLLRRASTSIFMREDERGCGTCLGCLTHLRKAVHWNDSNALRALRSLPGKHGRKAFYHRQVFLGLRALQAFKIHQLPTNCRKVTRIRRSEKIPIGFHSVKGKQEVFRRFIPSGIESLK